MMNQEKHKVVYKIKGGTWENKTNKPLVEFVEGNGVSKYIPVYMRHKMFHKSKGSWDKDPYTTRITEDTVFTYKYKLDPFFPFLAYSFVAILLAFSLFLSNTLVKKNNNPVIKDNMIAVAENIDYDDLVDPVVDEEPSRNPNFNTDSVSFGNDDTTTTNTDTPSLVNREDLTYYTVSFLNIDGSVLQSGRYQVGSVPSYTGSTPTYSDDEYRYTFTGWGSISAVTGNATYTAQYSRERIQQDDPTPQVTRYTITTSVNDLTMGSVTGGGTYDSNTTISLEVTANNGFHFVKWNDGSVDNPRSVTVTGNATYTATFEAIPGKGDVIKYVDDNEHRYRIIKVEGNKALVTALYDVKDSSIYGSDNTYAGSDLDNYLENTWYAGLSDNSMLKKSIEETPDLTQYVMEYTAMGTTGNIKETRTVGARHAYALELKDVWDYVGGKSNATTDNLQKMFNITKGGFWLRSAEDYGSGYAYCASGPANWSEQLTTFPLNYRPAFTIDLTKSGVGYFTETLYTISVSVDSTLKGKASIDGGRQYAKGETAVLKAEPKTGYHFVKWSDGNTDNPRTVTVTSDATYQAIFAQDVAVPEKGNVIRLKNIYGDNSTAEYRFRVLSINDNEAKLLALFNAPDSSAFDSNYSSVYANSELDTYLNDTWYSTLSDAMKGAIQPTNIVQNVFLYHYGSVPDGTENVAAKGTHGAITIANYYITDGYGYGYEPVSVGERNVFALDVQDVIDYLDEEDLSKDKINTMFNTGASDYVWLRSAEGLPRSAWFVDGYDGGLSFDDVEYDYTYRSGAYYDYAVRPAFIIDLSGEGVEFSIEDSDPEYTISTSVNDESIGSVSGAGTYDANATATLTATAIGGYHFVKWSDENYDNPRTVTVTSDATYEAIFALDIVATPVKGSVIKLKNIYGNNPNAEYRFRVLSTNGYEAKLLALFDAINSQVFSSNGSDVYAGSDLDKCLEGEENNEPGWYYSLSDTMKDAIVVTSIGQDVVDESFNVIETREVGDRHVFTLGITDIENYVGDLENVSAIKEMFNTSGAIWLRSAYHYFMGNLAWSFDGYVDGDSYGLNGRMVDADIFVRPAFIIDLSEEGVEFSIESSDPVVQQYTITTSVNNESMGSVTEGGTYNEGDNKILTATSNNGFHFSKWSDGNTDNPREIEVTEDATYEAIFEGDIIYFDDDSQRYRILKMDGSKALVLALFNASDSKVFNLNVSNVYDGSKLDTYLNDTWYDTLSDTMKGAIQPTDIIQNTYRYSDTPDTSDDFAGDITYKSQYKWNDSIYLNATLTASSDSISRKVFALDLKDIYDYFGEDVKVITSSQLNNMFFETESSISEWVWLRSAYADGSAYAWDVNGYDGDLFFSCVYGSSDAVRPAFNIDLGAAGVKFDVETNGKYAINATTNNNDYGTVTGAGVYSLNEEVTLTAASKDGHHFVKWLVDGADGSTNSTITITVTGDATYEAVFATTQYTITTSVNNESMGSVTEGGTYNEGDNKTLTATSNNGFHFSKWSDGNTDNPREIEVTEDAAYEAIFEGDIIYFENDSSHKYRILKMDGSKALVLALFNASDSQVFNSNGYNFYAGSELDQFLENEDENKPGWYNTLSKTMQDAIAVTSIVQDVVDYNNKNVTGTREVGNRHVFALGISEIKEYVGELSNTSAIKEMFNASDYVWLRSASADNSYYDAGLVNGGSGILLDYSVYVGHAVRPAFNIDLSSEDLTFATVTENKYAINARTNNNDYGTVTGAGVYSLNEEVTLTATSKDGYHFVKWVVNGVDDTSTDKNSATRTITVTSDATYTAVFEANTPAVTMPEKGSVIKLKNVFTDDPDTEYRFRVLSINGNEAKLLALFNASDSQVFNSNEINVYAGSELDTYLNTTWYETLSDTMKSAIGDDGTTGLQQHSYYWYSGIPSGDYVAKGTDGSGSNYYITEKTSDTRDIGDRYVFALDVQDAVDYIGKDNLSKDAIQNMFFMSRGYVCFRSAFADDSGYAWGVGGDNGDFLINYVGFGLAVRPAFNIDLSKEGVEFSIE